jgi:hypothetical protein
MVKRYVISMRDHPHGAAIFQRKDGAFVYYDEYIKDTHILEEGLAEARAEINALHSKLGKRILKPRQRLNICSEGMR